VLHTITRGEATVITLRYADGSAFSYEGFEIYFDDEEIAYQVGRTDARGRITFMADRSGPWRIRAFSEDGHGTDILFESTPPHDSLRGERPGSFRTERLVTGIAILFGLFGLLSLFHRRRMS
jgi:nickel transport protein